MKHGTVRCYDVGRCRCADCRAANAAKGRRHRAKHRVRPYFADDFDRFSSKVAFEPMSGCWLWTDALRGAGYGKFYTREGEKPAHRVSYEFFVGPIAPTLVIDHLCRNPACVNPAHLEPVTPGVNFLRGVHKNAVSWTVGRCASGLHEMAGDNVRFRTDGRRKCRACEKARRKGAAA